MAEETITILKVGTDEAVKSVNDLKDNVKVLKQTLGELEIGTEEYQNTLDELKVNQNALKDAMYATTASMDDLAKAATGTSESYNSLVHRMASLKEELRATDVSTEQGKTRFKELATEINNVNNKLKDMDALQGNFQRNVGNYPGLMKNFAGAMDTLDKGLKVTQGGVMGLKGGFEALSASPVIAIIGILVSLFSQLAGKLKDNETAMATLKKSMATLQPVMDFLSGIIEKLAGYLADVIAKVTEFVTSNGLIQKVINGVMGVGNAILQFVIAPFKGVIAAIKVFKEEGVKGLGDAAKAFRQEIKSGVSFKQNFQAGQEVAETFIAGAKSKKKEVKDAGKDLGKDAKDGFLEEIDKMAEELDKQMEADMAAWEKSEEQALKSSKKLEEMRLQAMDKETKHLLEMNDIMVEDEREKAEMQYAIQEAANQRKLQALEQFAQDALNRGDLDAYLQYEQEAADLEVEIETNALEEKKRLRELNKKDAEEKAKKTIAIMNMVAGATSSILGSMADMYEDDTKNAAKNAEKVKGLRIAAATIDTISGAVGAFMQASETIPPPYGQIVGAISAAAVTAAGMTQIAQIRNNDVSSSGASSSSGRISAISAAPTASTEVTNVRTVTSATEEERLNQMASDQRVYIVASDIEASQNQIKTQVAESSF